MEIENSVTIKGPRSRIYAYAAQVERWPEILPHYRRVEILESGEDERLVSMSCVRDFGLIRWPCNWRARQELLPEQGRIRYIHISGPVKGMRVEWLLEDTPDGVSTSIRHELSSNGSVWRRLYFNDLVGSLFVKSIATQTLETIKKLVERENTV